MRTASHITIAIASAASDAVASSAALSELYDWKFDFIFQLATRRLKLDEAAALDLVQEVMMRVIRHMKPLSAEADLDAWLTRVALNCACDHFRRERRRRARELAAATPHAVDHHEISALTAQIERLRTELSAMETGLFDVLAMRFRAGMPLAAIGRRIGLRPGAVDGRIRRGLAAIRAAMEERHDAE